MSGTQINLLIATAVSIFVLFLAAQWFTYQTTHQMIRPLRKLNLKMREIRSILEKGESCELPAGEESSFELSKLEMIFD